MQYIPDSSLNIIEADLDLSDIYPDKTFKVNVPQNILFIVLDQSNTLIGFTHEPIKHGKYFHPQPSTDFTILGQFYDNDGLTLPLLKNSYLLTSIHS